MIVLALDTATPQVGVALAGPDGPIASLVIREGRRHGEALAPGVQAVCAMAGVALADVGLVAADVGPGLFTGLRVGLATAGALASALRVPAVGVTSTEVLAAAHADAGRAVASVVDIRRGEVAWALYQPSVDGLVEVRPPQRSSPDALAVELARLGAGVLAVGDGARRYAGVLGVTVGGPLSDHPSPAVLAQLAAGARVDGEGRGRPGLAPCYLREADVRIGWDRAPDRG